MFDIFFMREPAGCAKCLEKETGRDCQSCGSTVEQRKQVFLHKAMDYLQKYGGALSSGDADIAGLTFLKASNFFNKLALLEDRQQLAKLNSLDRNRGTSGT